ncbi:hypothetical protein [Dyella sp. ASV21]|uniref:hypothetical protein n=1 Tax=Dyella sp. ASV21 TaxID=2795114 RepID=UPI0018EA7650|nr:hypothetical protein [Dyella sp. ASV21]
MPNLPHSIELHDSTISGIETRGNSLLITFSHAYVHLDGKGWSQQVEIQIDEPCLGGDPVSYPAQVAGGRLVTVEGPYDNLLMLPLSTKGPIQLEIEFVSGAVVRISGRGLVVSPKGVITFLEEVAGKL